MIGGSWCEVVDISEVVVDIHHFAVARQCAVVDIRRYIGVLLVTIIVIHNVLLDIIMSNIVVSIRLTAAAAAPVEAVQARARVAATRVAPAGCVRFFGPLLREIFSQ